MDTVVSKKGGSLARVLSITERMTCWQINVKIKTGETKSVIEVLDKLEKKRLTVYHCHPNCSSKRGSNEKQNVMMRRRHPKGTDFGKGSKKKLGETTERINNYPRKMFDFHPSSEAFEAAFPGGASVIQKILQNFPHLYILNQYIK